MQLAKVGVALVQGRTGHVVSAEAQADGDAAAAADSMDVDKKPVSGEQPADLGCGHRMVHRNRHVPHACAGP